MPSRSQVFPSALEFLRVGWLKLMVTLLVWILHGMAISCFAMAICLSILIGQAKAGSDIKAGLFFFYVAGIQDILNNCGARCRRADLGIP